MAAVYAAQASPYQQIHAGNGSLPGKKRGRRSKQLAYDKSLLFFLLKEDIF